MQRAGMTIIAIGFAVAAGAVQAEEKAGSAVPLTAEALDPDALDAARRYFSMPAMQGLSAMRHDPRAIAHRIGRALPEGSMTEDQRAVFLDMAMEELSGMKAERDETAIRVLAHVYTAEELEAMIAFERTEVGRRIAQKRPVYSVLLKDATATLRRDATRRIIERFTGMKTEPEQ